MDKRINLIKNITLKTNNIITKYHCDDRNQSKKLKVTTKSILPNKSLKSSQPISDKYSLRVTKLEKEKLNKQLACAADRLTDIFKSLNVTKQLSDKNKYWLERYEKNMNYFNTEISISFSISKFNPFAFKVFLVENNLNSYHWLINETNNSNKIVFDFKSNAFKSKKIHSSLNEVTIINKEISKSLKLAVNIDSYNRRIRRSISLPQVSKINVCSFLNIYIYIYTISKIVKLKSKYLKNY